MRDRNKKLVPGKSHQTRKVMFTMGFPVCSVVENLPANAGDNHWIRKIPWRRKWISTPVFLPGKSHEQRSLGDYSSWGHKRVRKGLGTKQQMQQKLMSLPLTRFFCETVIHLFFLWRGRHPHKWRFPLHM